MVERSESYISIANILEGTARSVFINMKDKSTWAKVNQGMTNGLMITEIGLMLRQKFYQRKQRSGKLEGEFAYQLEILLERAIGV